MSGRYAKKEETGKTKRRLDFSPRAIQKEVVKTTGQKPYVLYPLAVGVLGALAAIILEPSAWNVVPAILGGVVGLGAWSMDALFRREIHANQYLNRLRQSLSRRVDDAIRSLQGDLADAGAEQGLNQLHRLQSKYQAFEQLLRRKLDENELTFGRYLGMTEQVFLAGLDNLKSLADLLKGTSAIDSKHLMNRISQLDSSKRLNESERQELAALQARWQLLRKQQSRTQQLLAQNEEAMTQIDRVMAAIAEMEPGRAHAKMDMESAMQELERLARRAKDYSID